MKLGAYLRVMRILHVALLASVAVFGVVAVVVCQQGGAAPTDMTVFVIALAMTSVMEEAGIVFFRKLRMPPRRDGDEPVDLERVATEPERRAIAKLQTIGILSWALCESVAINGLVLAMLTHDIRYFVPFAAVGLVSMAAYAPTRSQFIAVIRGAVE